MHILGTKMDVFVCVLCSWRLSYGLVCPFLCLPLHFHTFVPLFFDSSPLFFIYSRSSTFPFLLPLAPSRVDLFSFAIAYHSYFYSTILLSFCPVDSPRLSIPFILLYVHFRLCGHFPASLFVLWLAPTFFRFVLFSLRGFAFPLNVVAKVLESFVLRMKLYYVIFIYPLRNVN